MSGTDGREMARHAGQEWLFPWHRRRSAILPAILPLALAVLFFAALLAWVRVRVAIPQFELERRGALIYLPDAEDGAAWTLRAREAGPDISRYDPPSWTGYGPLNAEVLAASTPAPPPYQPQLRDWPDSGLNGGEPLAPVGRAVLPEHHPAPAATGMPAARLVPALFPAAPLAGAALPVALPPLAGDVDAGTAGESWRFMLRLRPDGSVAECVGLTHKDKGNELLEPWLRSIRFDPKLAARGGWFAVDVHFTNQPADEPDHH